jgi:hypothetical protein
MESVSTLPTYEGFLAASGLESLEILDLSDFEGNFFFFTVDLNLFELGRKDTGLELSTCVV